LFTGGVPPSSSPGDRYAGSAAAAHWPGWPEIRADLRSSAGLILGLALAGIPVGLVWWLLAPRADFRITDDGPQVIGTASVELLAGDDVVFTLLLAGVGLLAGAAAWWLRRRRGVATVIALAVGAMATAVVASQFGELLGPGPTKAQLADVGARVTTALRLGGLAPLAVAPFTAVLAYLVPVLYTRGDDLGRVPTGGASGSGSPQKTHPDAIDPAGTGPDLIEFPPPGRPKA
jgi:LPXTG-motif cell wall-anchored protein